MKINITIALLCVMCVSCFPARSETKEGILRRRNDQFRARLPEAIQTIPRNSEYIPIGRQEKLKQGNKKNSNPGLVRKPFTAALTQIDQETIEVRDNGAEASNIYPDSDTGSYDDGRLTQSVQSNANSYNSDQGVKDGRLNFVISGQQGPHSYRFGYDTGKGADRTFRFEERDSAGIVHGRYGYYDPSGKFRIVNYSAHPEHGFSAANNFGTK